MDGVYVLMTYLQWADIKSDPVDVSGFYEFGSNTWGQIVVKDLYYGIENYNTVQGVNSNNFVVTMSNGDVLADNTLPGDTSPVYSVVRVFHTIPTEITPSSDSSASPVEFLAVSTVELTLTSAELLDNVSVASADLNSVWSGPTDAAAISAALGDTKTGMKDTVATDLESVVAGLFGVTPSSTKVVTWTEDTLLPTLFTEAQMVDITTQLITHGRGTLEGGFTLLAGDKIGVTVRIKKSETNYAEVNIFIQQT